MTKFAGYARLLIAALWVGSIWTIGYVVAPTLFASLDNRVLAGSIAASLFRIEAWLSIGCGALLLVLAALPGSDFGMRRRTWASVIVAMLMCTVISHFGIQPFMAELRAAPGGIVEGDAKRQFGMLHGISSVLYLLQSLLGVALIVLIRKMDLTVSKR